MHRERSKVGGNSLLESLCRRAEEGALGGPLGRNVSLPEARLLSGQGPAALSPSGGYYTSQAVREEQSSAPSVMSKDHRHMNTTRMWCLAGQDCQPLGDPHSLISTSPRCRGTTPTPGQA